MPERFDAINALVRERYETGAYGNAHLRMPQSLLDEFCDSLPRRTPAWEPWVPKPLGDLMGIPVVVDPTLPDGVWRLVDTGTDEVLHEGVIGDG
jgi:hypothetical protein